MIKSKKLFSILLVVCMILSFSSVVFAYGEEVLIPAGIYGTMCTYEKEMISNNSTHGWNKNSPQGELRLDAIPSGRLRQGDIFGLTNCAITDNRLMIATVSNIGGYLPVAIGDYLDVYFEDGTVWNCIAGDSKGAGVDSKWGHQGGKCIVEIIYWNYTGITGNVNKKISKIVKVGSYWDGIPAAFVEDVPEPAPVKKTITVTIAGKTMITNYGEAYIDGAGRTMVPLRAFSETLGYNVSWDDLTNGVIIKGNGKNVTFIVGSNEYKNSNGEWIPIDTVPINEDGRVFIPVRFAAESLGLTVGWDGASNSVTCY